MKQPTEQSLQKPTSESSQAPTERVVLTLAAQRLKERLSHLPAYAQQHKDSGDAFWAALSASSIGITG